jgi:hypothetical protein
MTAEEKVAAILAEFDKRIQWEHNEQKRLDFVLAREIVKAIWKRGAA